MVSFVTVKLALNCFKIYDVYLKMLRCVIRALAMTLFVQCVNTYPKLIIHHLYHHRLIEVIQQLTIITVNCYLVLLNWEFNLSFVCFLLPSLFKTISLSLIARSDKPFLRVRYVWSLFWFPYDTYYLSIHNHSIHIYSMYIYFHFHLLINGNL